MEYMQYSDNQHENDNKNEDDEEKEDDDHYRHPSQQMIRWLFHSDWCGTNVLTFLEARDALNLSLAVVYRHRRQGGNGNNKDDNSCEKYATLVQPWSKGKAQAFTAVTNAKANAASTPTPSDGTRIGDASYWRGCLNFDLEETHRHWYSRSYKAHCWQRVPISSQPISSQQQPVPALCHNTSIYTPTPTTPNMTMICHKVHTVWINFYWRNQGWPYHDSAIYILEDENDDDCCNENQKDHKHKHSSSNTNQEQQCTDPRPPIIISPTSISRRDFVAPNVSRRIVSRAHVRTKRGKNFVAGHLSIHHPQPHKVYRIWYQIGGGGQLEIRNVRMEYLLYSIHT
jgi:hypothetical protein